jgi:hypothetical protein
VEAKQTKTGRERSTPVLPNARAWLEKFRQDNGTVLPSRWGSRNKLDELPSYIARKTGVRWRDNAPRHSFGTYYFKLCKDTGKVVMAMGNSVPEFERHYWCKCINVTDDVAKEYFNIFPCTAGARLGAAANATEETTGAAGTSGEDQTLNCSVPSNVGSRTSGTSRQTEPVVAPCLPLKVLPDLVATGAATVPIA